MDAQGLRAVGSVHRLTVQDAVVKILKENRTGVNATFGKIIWEDKRNIRPVGRVYN